MIVSCGCLFVLVIASCAVLFVFASVFRLLLSSYCVVLFVVVMPLC